MTNSEIPAPKKKLKKWQIVALVLVVTAIIGQFTGSGDSTESMSSETTEAATAPEPTVDIFTKRACRKWRIAVAEGGKGVQTTAEIREGMKVVYEAAQFSEIPAIVDAGTRQLAAITSGDVEAFSAAALDFGNACNAVGQ